MPHSSPRRPVRPRFHLRTSRRLFGVFGLFIVLPGALLAVFALRVLRQEGQIARQRAREDLERMAAEISRDLDSEFRRWTDMLGSAISSKRRFASGVFPEPIGAAFAEPGGGVLLARTDHGLEVFPPGAILYVPSGFALNRTPLAREPSGFAASEALELGRNDYAGAAQAYRKLLVSADSISRPLVLQRLARTLRKAGRSDEAARIYRDLLGSARVWIGDLPSDLVARAELCSLASEIGNSEGSARTALDLFGELTMGTWLLDKPRYLYYSAAVRTWCRDLGAETGEFEKLTAVEESKLALSRAAEGFPDGLEGVIVGEEDTYLAFRSTGPPLALILSAGILGSKWWPSLLSGRGEDLDAVLFAADGTPVFGEGPLDPSPFAVSRNLRIDGAQWLLRIWPSRPEAIYAGIAQRRTFLLAILGFVTAFLVFGAYMTVRIVRRELEIARLRADFVSTVSHEFRTPLTGIRQLGGMLLDGRVPDAEKQRGYFKMIVHESDRLTRLVENILDFSRMEEGRREYRFEPLDPSPWLRALAFEFAAEAPRGGPRIDAEIPEGLPGILADKEALGSAFRNLMDNAVKYSAETKTFWVAAGGQGGEVWVSVRDEGIGISDEDQKRIFDRFFRAGGEISKKVKGAGLGLSLVKHIVAAHGGTVECRSRIGEGSVFTIRIPAARASGGG